MRPVQTSAPAPSGAYRVVPLRGAWLVVRPLANIDGWSAPIMECMSAATAQREADRLNGARS